MTSETSGVVVTGASSGIGRAIAIRLARDTHMVMLVGRNGAALSAVAEEISRSAGTCAICACDVTAPDAPQRILDATKRAFGRVDALVHAAGIYLVGAVDEVTLEDFDKQFAVNVRAPYALTLAALPELRRGSSLIFITSIFGNVGATESSVYCGTKGAVESMVRALALELGPRGVRVNAVAPGWVRTPMNEAARAANETLEQFVAERTAIGRWGEPGDIAPAVGFLLSAESGFVTGASLLVDGGWSAQ
jgi:NAD(P)-dependent dehydrogenase (short-subunit alcohol dehydrogenase family)